MRTFIFKLFQLYLSLACYSPACAVQQEDHRRADVKQTRDLLL